MLIGLAIVSMAVSSVLSLNCYDYVVISSRGTYEPQGASNGFVGMLNATFATVPNGIEYDTVYPASTNLTGAIIGVADIVRYINAGVEACPSQAYALLGYSQGASVTDIALHNFTDPSSAAYNAIKAVVVIGNPGHVYGAAANVDQNGGDTTRNFTGSYYLGGAGAIPDVYYTDNKVLDICYQGDLVCALPPNGTFAIEPVHLLYGSTPEVQDMGARFLIQRLAGGVSATGSATASPEPTATRTVSQVTTSPSTSTTSTVATASATYSGVAASWRGIPPLLVGMGVALHVAAF